MPNHVTNRLTFKGSQEDVNNLLSIIKGEEREIDFTKIIPVPDYIFQGDLGMEEKRIYGKNNWYDWNIENWGTKWNAYNIELGYNSITFDTAWATPMNVIDKLAEMFPHVIIEHEWADEDTGHNTGKRILQEDYIEGGYYDNKSNEAYEVYIELKGESNCLGKNNEGNYIHYNCDDCPNKDKC